jgi:DNA-binding GntR family transcriptional regulator
MNKIDISSLYNNIRTRIYTLEYPPGEALREEVLASEFGVSRTPIRQVLQTLEYEGLVTNKPGIGSIVTIVDLKDLKEVYAFRLKLAEIIGELSSPRITPETITALDALLKEINEMRKCYDPKGLALLYLRFHDLMMPLVTNRYLRKTYDQLFHLTARVWLQILPELEWEDEVEMFSEEIRDVIKSLRAHDLNAMSVVRRNHMAMLLVRINRYLGSADNGNSVDNQSSDK